MKKLFSLVCTCLLAMSMQAAETDKYDALYENLPFQMEKVTRPQFPANEVNLKDFGAVGDGSTLCTEKKCGAYRGKGAYHERGENAYF